MKSPLLPALYLGVAVCFFAGTANGGPPSLRLGKAVSIPELGIKFRAFDDCQARPLPTLNRIQRNGREWVLPHEWWIHDQHVGVWGSALGEIVAAKVDRPFPENSAKLTPIKDCEKIARITGEWNETDLRNWVEHFTGCRVVRLTPDRRMMTDRKVLGFDLIRPSGRELVTGYLVTSSREPERRIFLLYRLSPMLEVAKAMRTVLKSVDSLDFQIITTVSSRQPDKSYRTGNTRPPAGKTDYTPEYLNSRRQVIDNIRNYRDWFYLETEHFIIVSNIRSRRSLRMLAETIEKSRSAYSAYFPIRGPIRAVSTVRLFQERQDYLNYVGAAGEQTIGMWMPLKRELAVSPLDFLSRGDQREMMAGTLTHEGFHQYIHFAIGEVENAPWFNEGTAEYFEGLDVGNDRHEVKAVEGRLEAVRRLLKRERPDFAALFRMTLPEFYAGNVADHYTLAGALMYYLFKGAAVTDKQEYTKVPERFYQKIVESGDWRKATETAWQGIDLKQFTDDFIAFWSDDSGHGRAEAYNPVAP